MIIAIMLQLLLSKVASLQWQNRVKHIYSPIISAASHGSVLSSRELGFSVKTTKIRSSQFLQQTTTRTSEEVNKEGQANNNMATSKKYKCAGCAYVFDEAKGYKKRYPAGNT